MIQGSESTFPIAALYTQNVEKRQKENDRVKNFKELCKPTALDLKECFDKHYDKDIHEVPIDGDTSGLITNRYGLLMDCNFDFYVKCRNEKNKN